jgi:lipopolysaccharide/colanic/teichoic acid biosynthesis glycosyltransferase
VSDLGTTVRTVGDGPTTQTRTRYDPGRNRPGPLPRLPPARSPRHGRWLKYSLDRLFAAIGIVVTAPLFVLVSLLLLAHGVRAVLRVQTRIGDRGAFPLASFAIPPALEHRWIGRMLRASGLVVLPQIFSVLRGHLSMIGPRPRYPGEPPTPTRPGMAGLAQTAQATRALDRDEVFALDAVYAREWSLGLDLRLIGQGMWRVFVPR